jgi:hypothetical protein
LVASVARQATIEDLRHAIDSLPRETRVAMLDGIRQSDIIVGADPDHGGICPMLASFRAGGRAIGHDRGRKRATVAAGTGFVTPDA